MPAVTFESSSRIADTTDALTVPHLVPSLISGCIVGFFASGNATPVTCSGMTWTPDVGGPDTMTVTTQAGSDNMGSGIGYALAPTEDDGDMVATGTATDNVVAAANFENVLSVTDATSANATSTSPSLTITSDTDHMVVASLAAFGASNTFTSPSATEVHTQINNNFLNMESYRDAGASPNVVVSATADNEEWVMTGFTLNPTTAVREFESRYRVFG